jgi:hypothetical protein
MTTPIRSITCAEFGDRLADVLERETDDATRAAVEAHAAACADCGALLGDLRDLRTHAANLPELVPSRDLWPEIAARIATPVIELPGRAKGYGPGAKGRWAWIGVAAAGLVAISAGVTHVLTRQAYTKAVPPTQVVNNAAPAPTRDSITQVPVARGSLPVGRSSTLPEARGPRPEARNVANTKPSAEQTYDREINELRALVNRRRTQLDPVTLGVIERNLKVIDDAIAQCRSALARDPASRFLIESLDEALGTKVQLLRTAAMLPSKA